MKKIFALALVVLGSFLEVFYNSYRYHQDGIPIFICITIGLALNIFLIVCVMERRPILATFLILFSIISTSSGQTFALINKDKKEVAEIVNPERERIMKENEKLLQERDEINKQIGETVKTLEDRYTWKNTLERADGRKGEIEAMVNENKKRLELIESATGVSDNETIYSLYSRLVGGNISVDWLKFILHTILSVFIATMSPVGVFALEKGKEAKDGKLKDEKMKDEKPVKATVEAPAEKKDLDDYRVMTTDDWIRWFFREIRYGNNNMPSHNKMKEYAFIAGKEWNERIHFEALKICADNGILTKEGRITGAIDDAKRVLKIG